MLTKVINLSIGKPRYHGLKNQGATCYLNSVLQVLYMTKDFREAVKGFVQELKKQAVWPTKPKVRLWHISFQTRRPLIS
uniref:USP domain-containing protein n=1 Tax=Poecilia reticulata TaxID=8081 RepID=A0A3P9NCY2_POERE